MDETILVEKYRPKTIDDCILPDELKKTFKKFVEQGSAPHILISGPPGTGKTSVIKAMINELNADYIMINGSLNGDIDTLRNDIQSYASTISMNGGRKYVIWDEADYLTPKVMAAARGFIEQFSDNVTFILTCNFKNRIIEPLHSRCTCIDLKINKSEKSKLAGQFLKRLEFILQQESIEYDKAVLVELIKKHFPDFRRIINECQRYATNGSIDTGILSLKADESIAHLIEFLKNKKFTEMRKWVGENSDLDTNELYRRIYDNLHEYVKPQSIPNVILILAKYQYQAAFVVDKEINDVACLTEIMLDTQWI